MFDLVGTALGALASVAMSVVSPAFSAIKDYISPIAATTLRSVVDTLDTAINSLGTASLAVQVINSVLQSLGLLEPQETVEDRGAKIIHAYNEGNIKIEDYSSYEEFMRDVNAVNLENPFNKEEYKFSDAFSVGLFFQAIALNENFGEGSAELLACILKDPDYFSKNRLESWKKQGANLDDVGKYFLDQLHIDDANRIEQNIIKVEQQLNPDKSLDLIYQDLDKYRQKN